MIRAWLTGPQGDNISVDAVTDEWKFTPRLPASWKDHGITRSGGLPRILPGFERENAVFRPVEGMANRDVQNYRVARYSNFDPNGSPAAGSLMELATTGALSYEDYAWAGQPQG
jgi:hypothetical protein